MTQEKFLSDTNTVLDFIQTFCNDKHKEAIKNQESLELFFHDKKVGDVEYKLCLTCKETFLYSYERLQNCPHDEKPRCRNCPNPCYEKPKWKALALIMRYSGMKKGLLRVKKMFIKS